MISSEAGVLTPEIRVLTRLSRSADTSDISVNTVSRSVNTYHQR